LKGCKWVVFFTKYHPLIIFVFLLQV